MSYDPVREEWGQVRISTGGPEFHNQIERNKGTSYDRGQLDISSIKGGDIVAHEFSHLLGLDDNLGRVLSNTYSIDGGYTGNPEARAQAL